MTTAQPDLEGDRLPGGFTYPMVARLAKTAILFLPPTEPPAPSALTSLGGVVHVVCWTDLEAARAALRPGERLVQAKAGELARTLSGGSAWCSTPPPTGPWWCHRRRCL